MSDLEKPMSEFSGENVMSPVSECKSILFTLALV